MKTYNEMAANALKRIEEHEKVIKKRKNFLLKTVVPAFSICLALIIGIKTSAPVSNDPIDVPVPKNEIFINHYTGELPGFGNLKFNIALKLDDFVVMDEKEICEYYGVDIFPDVPADLEEPEDQREVPYGIFRRNGGTGEVYWDQEVLWYTNEDCTRDFHMEIAKEKLPYLDYGIYEEEMKASLINGNEVYIVLKDGLYCATMIYKNVGFVITSDGLSETEFIAAIESIIS